MEGFDEGLAGGVSLVFFVSLWFGLVRMDKHVDTDCCEAIVWRAREGGQIYFWGWFGDGYFSGVADGDFEEGLFCHCFVRCCFSGADDENV